MATQRPASQSNEATPTSADSGEVASAAVSTDPTLAAPDSTPIAGVADSAQPLPPAQRVIYVEAPKPFVARGNRGFGVLIALLSTVIFAALYVLVDISIAGVNRTRVDFGFITTLDFFAPVIMFAVGFVILVLVANRAGWAAHVLGSIFVGLVVLFGGTGLILLLHINQIPSNGVAAAFSQVLFSTGFVIAALLAREVALWMGFAVAARGRRVKARNVRGRVLYDEEIAAQRAEYERANVQPTVDVPPAEPVAGEGAAAAIPAP